MFDFEADWGAAEGEETNEDADLKQDNDLSVSLEREACEILNVNHAVDALVRPMPATAQKLKSLVSFTCTLKLDGKRCLVLYNSNCVEALFFNEPKAIVRQNGKFEHLVSVIDCEYHEGNYYALDMLVFENKDIRHHTLYERLEKMKGHAPPEVSLKPYRTTNIYDNARVCVQALYEQKSDDHDGVIMMNVTDPYWTQPLKFKEYVTCDFILEAAANGDGFVLLYEKNNYSWNNHKRMHNEELKYHEQNLEILRGYDQNIIKIRLLPYLVSKLGLSYALSRADNVVGECMLTKNGIWSLVRIRHDRSKANSQRVVESNIKLVYDKCTTRSWLLSNLPYYNEFHVFMRWMEAQMRFLINQFNIRRKTLGEIGCKAASHHLYGSSPFDVIIFDAKHGFLKSQASSYNNIRYSMVAFTENTRQIHHLFSFFTVGLYFKSKETMQVLAKSIASCHAQSFTGLFWTSGEDLHNPGRYSLTTQKQPDGDNDLVSFAISSGTPESVYSPNMEDFKSIMSQHGYEYSLKEYRPAALEENGCPINYQPLANRIELFSFERSE